MKTMLKRTIAGVVITILASAFSGCSPVFVASSRPRPVIYTQPQPVVEQPVYASTIPVTPAQTVVYSPVPVVQTVVVTPVVPVWAPPYTYVTEVHYYYFPDYMVYYDVFAQNYCYFDGFTWLHIVTVPSIPMFVGFSPYNSYLVIMNRSITTNPWARHEYFEQQYPRGYYNDMYAPRQSLSSNTVLRAYDENQGRPMFVDKRSNREVPVKYEVRNVPRTAINSNSTRTPATDNPRNTMMNQNPRTTVESNNPTRTNLSTGNSGNNTLTQRPMREEVSREEVKRNQLGSVPRNNSMNQNARPNINFGSPRPEKMTDHRSELKNNSTSPVRQSESMQGKIEPRKNENSTFSNQTKRPDALELFKNQNAEKRESRGRVPEKQQIKRGR